MANLLNFTARLATVGHAAANNGSRANTSLNVAYVHKTSGAALAIRYCCPSASSIDELYVFLDATTGTRGNVTVVCDIYNENAGSGFTPGSTLRDTNTAVSFPASDDKWIKFTFGTPYTPTVGEILWLIIYNTAADPTTDFPQIMSATNTLISNINTNVGNIGLSTANGFSTAGAVQGEFPFAVKQGSDVFGQPYTQILAGPYASTTRKRGIAFTLTEDVTIAGMITTGTGGILNGFQIFDSSTAPGGSPLYSYSTGSDTNEVTDEQIGIKMFDAVFTLPGPASYKAVLTYGSVSTTPGAWQIEDYAAYSSVFDAMIESFNMCGSCLDDGSNGWTLDNSLFPGVGLILSTIPTIVNPNAGGYLLIRTASLF